MGNDPKSQQYDKKESVDKKAESNYKKLQKSKSMGWFNGAAETG